MDAKNGKEKTIKKNKIKIWVFGVITLVLIMVAVSLLILKQGEMTTSVNIDGATVYALNENSVNYFMSSTIAYLVIVPSIIVFLTMTIIYFVKDVRFRKTKKKLSR